MEKLIFDGKRRYDCTMIAVEGEDHKRVRPENVIEYVMQEVIPLELDEKGYGNVVCFVTDTPDNALFDDVPEEHRRMRTFVVLVREVDPDTVFYLAAVTRADAFAYATVDEKGPIVILWHRINGIASYRVSATEETMDKVDDPMVRHFMPASLFDTSTHPVTGTVH